MPNARSAYLDASVATASPARLLVMLCDRLVLDVTRAADALRADDLEAVNRQLLHAQDIVLELQSSLKVDVWSGARALTSLYDFLLQQLVRANVGKDLELIESCHALASQIAGAWREAAAQSVAASA